MSSRDARDALLLAYCMDIIDNVEFSLLYDVNTSKNPDLPYWKYTNFDLDSIGLMMRVKQSFVF